MWIRYIISNSSVFIIYYSFCHKNCGLCNSYITALQLLFIVNLLIRLNNVINFFNNGYQIITSVLKKKSQYCLKWSLLTLWRTLANTGDPLRLSFLFENVWNSVSEGFLLLIKIFSRVYLLDGFVTFLVLIPNGF